MNSAIMPRKRRLLSLQDAIRLLKKNQKPHGVDLEQDRHLAAINLGIDMFLRSEAHQSLRPLLHLVYKPPFNEYISYTGEAVSNCEQIRNTIRNALINPGVEKSIIFVAPSLRAEVMKKHLLDLLFTKFQSHGLAVGWSEGVNGSKLTLACTNKTT